MIHSGEKISIGRKAINEEGRGGVKTSMWYCVTDLQINELQ